MQAGVGVRLLAVTRRCLFRAESPANACAKQQLRMRDKGWFKQITTVQVGVLP